MWDQYDGLHEVNNFQQGTVSGNTVPTPLSFQTWTLSKAGDWTAWNNNGATDTRTHNNIHALTARSVVANPQLYDSNFNQTDDGANYLLTYDANDRLQQVQNRVTMAVIASYRYDAVGHRVEKNVGGAVTNYYYAGDQVVEEHDGTDTVTAFYTYGDYIDEPLTMDRGGNRYYYHANRLYSTYLLTNRAGGISERYAYTPYGVATTYDGSYTTPQTTSRVGNPYLFTGRELDAETLLCFYRARTYDPMQGRFKQLDPIGFGDTENNLYRYTLNSPLAADDPSGLLTITLLSRTKPLDGKCGGFAQSKWAFWLRGLAPADAPGPPVVPGGGYFVQQVDTYKATTDCKTSKSIPSMPIGATPFWEAFRVLPKQRTFMGMWNTQQGGMALSAELFSARAWRDRP